MTITPVTPPVAPNGNTDRAMYAWIPKIGGLKDPLATDATIQSLLNWCSVHGVTTIFLDMWLYLGNSFTSAHVATVQKFIYYAHSSGIKVYALAGNNDWGHNKQWVMDNITTPIANFNALVNPLYPGASFDGVSLDVEYWTVAGYNASIEGPGLFDLVASMKAVLNIPVGCYADDYMAMPTSNAQTYTYDGYTLIEGLQFMRNTDFVVVACFYHLSAYQIADLQLWYNYGVQQNQSRNLYCLSLTDTGYGKQSYWTGAAGAIATMETNHTSVSNAFTTTTDTVFKGQCIEQYNTYKNML